MHRIEVSLKPEWPDPKGNSICRDIQDLGITSVSEVRVIDVFWLEGQLSDSEVLTISGELLSDKIIQTFKYDANCPQAEADGFSAIEVTYNAGVTDPVQETILKAISDLGIKGVTAAKTAKRYLLKGEISADELDTIGSKLLINPIVQHVVKSGSNPFPPNPKYTFKLRKIDLLAEKLKDNMASLGKEFSLSHQELSAIYEHYLKLGRAPTDAELETLAQTWSEHCCHKTFKAMLDYDGQIINNLLKQTIAKATAELNKPWCLSVFVDNSGVIEFDDNWGVCFKAETHNHPSAVEPYGGAATGIGGVIRDILGTGLAAKPIANTDVFCFGQPDLPENKLPPGVLHPRRVFKGVRSGVADYGNRMGIPTVNGAVLFDERYTANPLVYCGTIGLIPKKYALPGKQSAGDLVVLIGGRTGRDGIHGVTFASGELNDRSTELSFTAVQIGNPIVEKRMLDTLLAARDRELFVRITDCGGGGLSSAIGEMAESTGVKVYLDKVPLKYSGLTYSEIWISESQERMLLAVKKEKLSEIMALFESEGVEASVIGEFSNDRHLKLFYEDNPVADLQMDFLHNGRPQLELTATRHKHRHPEADFDCPEDLEAELKNILSHWNVCSREWIIRQYDHEVQGGSVLKPMAGAENDGPGDAAVIRPVLGSKKAVVISNGINPSYADVDAYNMAASAIDEALRQIIAVGGNLNRVALLDNFSWGNASRPESLGDLVRACQACHDLSLVFETPFISGKDSLNNEFRYNDKLITIPHTLLISAIGVMEDGDKAVSMDFKKAGNLIYIVGKTAEELGGSHYFKNHSFIGNRAPAVNAERAKENMQALSSATAKGFVAACHDLSEGGLGVAAAEMAFSGKLGANIRLADVPLSEKIEREDYILFSESNSRFLAEVSPEHKAEFEKLMQAGDFGLIGEVTAEPRLKIAGRNGSEIIINIPVSELKEAWQRPMRW